MNVVKWWMKLDPATQYMYWIMAFAAMLLTGVSAIVAMVEYGVDFGLIIIISSSIFAFVALFMLVILFFTVFYPLLLARK